jgi:MHS family shikimate/dehydroshikimate transporter-like MFS transporter
LIVTLLLTGIATFAVGLVPTYDSIGIWGALIVLLLRLAQPNVIARSASCRLVGR